MAKSPVSTPIYSGEFRHALDDKNRLTIPAAWREEGATFYVVKNPKRQCLTVLPPDVFQEVGELAKTKVAPAQQRVFVTNFYSQARNAAIDKQGRLLLPDDHCKAVGLRTDVVLTGSSDRFELWSPASWKAFRDEQQSTYEEVAELVGL